MAHTLSVDCFNSHQQLGNNLLYSFYVENEVLLHLLSQGIMQLLSDYVVKLLLTF